MTLLDTVPVVDLSGNELKNYRRKKKILTLLYNEDTLSATEIGRRIGVSIPTSTSLLRELSEERYVKSRGSGKSRGGRRPELFGLRSDTVYVVSCELGWYTCKIGIFNPRNQLVAPIEIIETNSDDALLVDKIYAAVQKIIKENDIKESLLFGIGLAMPGLVDETNGINYSIKDKALQPIVERFKEKFDTLIYINNDARMQAYGEFVFGAAKGYQNALVVNWNWGLGFGMIVNGELYNGSSGFAGELSHTKSVEDGDLCICGKRGCLETIVSVNVIIRRAQEAVKTRMVSQLTAKFKDRETEIGIKDIIKAARKGDECCIELLNSVSVTLGKALSTSIQLLNQDIIVLGGVVTQANKHILVPIQQTIDQYCLEEIAGNVKLVISENWKESGLLGVTASLYQKLFSNLYN
ncbi:MAG: ROK family protein [Aestuariibaculum sp.]